MSASGSREIPHSVLMPIVSTSFLWCFSDCILPVREEIVVELWFNVTVNTVELQWLEHIWDHENMFKTGVVRASEC